MKLAGEDEDNVVVDMGVVTARNSKQLHDFADMFTKAIANHRFWEREEKDKDMIPV